jgi:hypothetical protein
MNSVNTNTTIVDCYLGLLGNLSADNKLDLIARLSASVKADLADRKSSFQKAFGAFETDKSAEEINEEIRSSRNFNRQIEEF